MADKPLTKLDLDKIGQIYCRLMEEIVVRDEILNTALAGRMPIVEAMTNMPEMREIAIAETCYLQLRMICELIALGCLAAHGDIEAARTKRITKAPQADWIMKALLQLHTRFYPKPSKQVLNKDGRPMEVVNIEGEFLGRENLLDLYNECGGFLHRGSLKHVLAEKRPKPDFARIKKWADGTWALLNHHQIQLIDPELQIIGLMKDKVSRRAQFSFWKKGTDGKFHFQTAIRATGA
jgi:hypothetical protein